MSFKRSKSARKNAAAKKKHSNKVKSIAEKKHAAKPLMKTDDNGKWFYVETGEYLNPQDAPAN